MCSITMANLVVADFVISPERVFRQEKWNTVGTTRYSVALLAKHYLPLSAMTGSAT